MDVRRRVQRTRDAAAGPPKEGQGDGKQLPVVQGRRDGAAALRAPATEEGYRVGDAAAAVARYPSRRPLWNAPLTGKPAHLLPGAWSFVSPAPEDITVQF